MLESGVGAVSVPPCDFTRLYYPSDVFPSSRFYRQDITEPEVKQDERCQVLLTDVPGVGFEPVPERLDRVTLYREVFQT